MTLGVVGCGKFWQSSTTTSIAGRWGCSLGSSKLVAGSMRSNCKSVWKIIEQEDPPVQSPRLENSIRTLARLRGYNGRRGVGPAGSETIWRGTRRMLDFAICWNAFGPDQNAHP